MTATQPQPSSISAPPGRLIVCLIGPPAAGKSGHAALLSASCGLPTVSVGGSIRQELTARSDLGELLAAARQGPPTYPDEIALGIVVRRLAEAECSRGAILDGFPRSPVQAHALTTCLLRTGDALVTFVLDIPDEEVLARVRGRHAGQNHGAGPRSDDASPEFVRRRIEDFRSTKAAIVDVLRHHGEVHDIAQDLDAEGTDHRGMVADVVDRLLGSGGSEDARASTSSAVIPKATGVDSTLLLLDAFDATTPPERMREQLRRTGAVYLTGYLDRRVVSECRQLVLRALAAHGWIEEGTDPPIPRDPVHRIGSVAFTRCLESILVHERLHEVGHGARLVELAGALLDDEAFAHPRKMVRLAYPTHRSPLDFIPPHQDIVYVKGEPDTLTFWIPLGDVPPSCGGLRLWEGSHLAGLRPVAANREGRFQCSAADLTEAGAVWSSADFRMGDVLVFHSLTVHGSGHNDSDAMRLSMDCRYSSANGVVNADQLLPAYHPALPGWDQLGAGWSALDLTAVAPSLTIEDADAPVADALARRSRFT